MCTKTQDSWTKWLEDLNLSMNTDVVYEHLHVAYVGRWFLIAYVGQWFLVAFVAVSFLGQLVVVALSVPDSLVAFLAVAFLVQLVVCVLGAVQAFHAVSSDDHSRVYLVIRLLAVLASLVSSRLRSRVRPKFTCTCNQ